MKIGRALAYVQHGVSPVVETTFGGVRLAASWEVEPKTHEPVLREAPFAYK